MIVKTKAEAWNEVNKIFPTDYEKDDASSARAGYDIYRHHSLNYYNRICDLGCRLEVLTGEYGENVTNIWIEPETEEEPKKTTGHRAIVHYTLERGNSQYQLQLLAADIINHGKRVAEARSVAQEFSPNGDKRIVETGHCCVEVINEFTGSRYWVHFSGCRVSEILEEYIKE